ncbi:MAG: alpha/beta fold hydrolase [Acidobacteria bacterium]|nr:MAG: alpha/beta fold hydrolase [Acidobacteriota bacterium]
MPQGVLRTLLAVAVVSSLPATARAAKQGGDPPSPAAGFATAPCAFHVPAGQKVRCGWLTVPENRVGPGGRTIRLHVAIYASRSPHPAPDPIVWLVGGPGGRAHDLSSRLFHRVVAPYLATRDFIVLDVRGTGYSQPALSCPEDRTAPGWLQACRDHLRTVADLSCYNSASVAADLADLRRALRIREGNIFAESYGTRLALSTLRDCPEGVRAVVLDSVVPPEADQYADGPSKFEGALSALFEDCARDAACNGAFPTLRATLLEAADALDASPRRLSGTWHNVPLAVRFDGRQLLQAVDLTLYESDMVSSLPWAIAHAVDGSADSTWLEVIGRHEIFVSRRIVDQGAHLSYACAEEVPFTDVARLRKEDDSRAGMRQAATGLSIVEACRAWGTRPTGRRETMAVTSRVPVLLLSGRYDPVTPPSYARQAASHLANAQVFEFRGLGHWLTANEVTSCPQRLVLQFLDDPRRKLDAACVADKPPAWRLR